MDETNLNLEPEVKEKTTLVDKVRKLFKIKSETKLGGETRMFVFLLLGTVCEIYTLIEGIRPQDTLFTVFYILLLVCFLICVLKPKGKLNLRLVVGALLGLIAYNFISTGFALSKQLIGGLISDFDRTIRVYDEALFYMFSRVIFLTVGILLLIPFIGVIRKGQHKKLFSAFLRISMLFTILAFLAEQMGTVFYRSAKNTLDGDAVMLYLFATMIACIGILSLFIALITLARKNDISQIFSEKINFKKVNVNDVASRLIKVETTDTEAELAALDDMLNDGTITESEYRERRTEILSRL